jgi:hypothetical protein
MLILEDCLVGRQNEAAFAVWRGNMRTSSSVVGSVALLVAGLVALVLVPGPAEAG